jgi:hypothetical protein
VLAALVAVLAAGCSSPSAGSGTATVSPSASETNPYGAAVVDPLGPDEPVLTLSGGTAGKVQLTFAQLEGLGTTSVTVNEPFVKTQQSFTGVPISAIFDRAGIPSTAKVTTVALNDYEYAAVAGDLEASNALIATQRDGSPIPYDQGGPIRLIYPDGSALSPVLDAWNWSLSSIEVDTTP